MIEEEYIRQDTSVRMQSVGNSDPPLIENHQIYNFGGGLKPVYSDARGRRSSTR